MAKGRRIGDRPYGCSRCFRRNPSSDTPALPALAVARRGESPSWLLAVFKTLLITQLVPLAFALGFHAWERAPAPRLVKPLNVITQILMVTLNVFLFIAY